MPRILKKRTELISDGALGWISGALVLLAAIILDIDSGPRKWHAAIIWTAVAFAGLIIWGGITIGRRKKSLLPFWIFWSACLILHVFAMWLIFGQLLPRLVLGTLYVIPVAFIESTLLIALFFALERKLDKGSG